MFREFVKDNLPKDILPELTFLEKRKEILEAVKEKAKDDEKPAEVRIKLFKFGNNSLENKELATNSIKKFAVTSSRVGASLGGGKGASIT